MKKIELKHIADLSALNIDIENENNLIYEIESIISMVSVIDEADIYHEYTTQQHNGTEFRNDICEISYDRKQILLNSPKHTDEYFTFIKGGCNER